MVTISTTDAEKEKANNVTPKKKAANNSTAATAAASTETATEQTAPNILVYKKVRERARLKSGSSASVTTLSDGGNRGEDAGRERWRGGANGESLHVKNSIRV